MSHDLSRFWSELETSFPLGGARRRLLELLGEELEQELERTGVLVLRYVATHYPCVQHAGPGCPRVIYQRMDGSFVAECGNAVAECSPIELTRRDIDFLSVSPERLAYVVGKALRLRVRVEPVSGIPDAYRFGTFNPEPGVEHTVYFLACCHGRDYGMAIDALRMQGAGRSIAILVPTERYLSESLCRHAAAAGVPLIALADVLVLGDDGGMRAVVDPLQLFAAAGVAASVAPSRTHVATVFQREDGRPAVWRRLDQTSYQRLIGRASRFDVFGDELTRTVHKASSSEPITDVPAGQFRWIRAALESPRHFDPGTGDDDGVAAKQLFRRARRMFDVKTGDGWALFQTRLVENHATYRFDPKPGMSFAFVFAAREGDLGAKSTVDDEQTPIEISISRRRERRPDA